MKRKLFKLKHVFLLISLISVFTVNYLLEAAPLTKENLDNRSVRNKKLINGNNAFCLDLYHELEEKEGNIFFSPYSISTALAMTYAGARGDTEKEMAEVLHFKMSQEKLHPSFFELSAHMGNIEDKGDVALSVANSLWIRKAFDLKKNFLRITNIYYGAKPFCVDFTKEKTRQKINRWVEKKTKKKIKNLIPKGILNSYTRLVLINAIYFKGNWASQFKKSQTRDMPFWISEGRSVDIPMMYQKSSFKYMEGENIQMLEIPYKGNDLSMLVLLPKKRIGMKQLEQRLTQSKLNTWIERLHKQEVEVYFPKFKMTCTYRMKNTLINLGMKSAFQNADFSGMSDIPLAISEVIHKAFVEVNEKGTEAAAATAVIICTDSVEMNTVFRADHPFIFLIKENKTGSILFMGRVSNPS